MMPQITAPSAITMFLVFMLLWGTLAWLLTRRRK